VNINALDVETKRILDRDLYERKSVVISGVDLPRDFRPSTADVVLILLEGNTCEIYIDSLVSYSGHSLAWREICSRPESAGETRFVASVSGDLFTALNKLSALLAGAATRHERIPRPDVESLTEMEDVIEGLEPQVVPESFTIDEEALLDRLKTRVLGQDGALRALCSEVARHRAKSAPSRPVAVFALGPTGVGKTRAAQELADAMRDLEGAGATSFLRLDMNEYQEEHRISQLLGAPQGYVGHGSGSQLLEVLQQEGGAIVLFDEIDKAHPAILKVLMNAMDAGRISSAGEIEGSREVDCRDAIFIFTSNHDATEVIEDVGALATDVYEHRFEVDDIARKHLLEARVAPEIIGRLSRFLLFLPLDEQTRAAIVTLAVQESAEEYGIRVTYIEPSVIIEVMRVASDGGFGARPIRYLVDDLLGSALVAAVAEDLDGKPVRVCGPPFILEAQDSQVEGEEE
jgi:ATP-dependent Clp protease ATP-binding subunit ClpA